MTVISKTKTRSLRNWVADGVITATQANDILVADDKAHSMTSRLVSYDELGKWGYIKNSLRFDVSWNSAYSASMF